MFFSSIILMLFTGIFWHAHSWLSCARTCWSTTTSSTALTCIKPRRSYHVFRLAYSRMRRKWKISTHLRRPRYISDLLIRATSATRMQSVLLISRTGMRLEYFLCCSLLTMALFNLHRAYNQEFGSNFTSAIPTNVFGEYDNLYASARGVPLLFIDKLF